MRLSGVLDGVVDELHGGVQRVIQLIEKYHFLGLAENVQVFALVQWLEVRILCPYSETCT
jgi:hypothetical protein